jgi:hypothetical protein
LTSLVRRSGNFPQECDLGPTHTILGFQAQVEAQAIDRCHLGILGLNVSKPLREQVERILIVGVHVVHDLDLVVNQRIWPGLGILRGRNPPHNPKASDEVDVHDIHSEKEEIVKIDPSACCLGNSPSRATVLPLSLTQGFGQQCRST